MARRLPVSLLVVVCALLVAAAPVLAHDGGEGWYGETDDKVITNAGFLVILFFPLFVFAMSLLQSSLEKRKERRKAAEKARAAAGPDGSGGW